MQGLLMRFTCTRTYAKAEGRLHAWSLKSPCMHVGCAYTRMESRWVYTGLHRHDRTGLLMHCTCTYANFKAEGRLHGLSLKSPRRIRMHAYAEWKACAREYTVLGMAARGRDF